MGGEFFQESGADESAAQKEQQTQRDQIGSTFVTEGNSSRSANFSQAVQPMFQEVRAILDRRIQGGGNLWDLGGHIVDEETKNASLRGNI